MLDATANKKDNCNEFMYPMQAIHRWPEMSTEAEGGHFEQLL